MQKLKAVIMAIIMLTMATVSTASINPTTWITKDTPFIGGFVDDTPPELAKIHNDILDRLTPVPGTKPFEYKILDNGKIAGYVQPDGTPGWCSNYAAAVRQALLDYGYRWDQIKYAYCSIYDADHPDHVVDLVVMNDGTRWIMDAAKDFVMKPEEYPKKLTVEGIQSGNIAYIWWARADGRWIRAEL